jgi:capsular polysaccharide biosynthesis protein
MELNEAAHRILWQHRVLILAFVLLGAAAAVLAHRDDVATYTSTTRFVIDAEDPTSQTESAAVADTAKAIATSPSQVQAALEKLGIAGRDPVEMGRHRIALRPLGTSGVLRLSVSDPSRKAAVALADELARRVIAKRLDIKRGHLRDTVQRLDSTIAELTTRIGELRLAGGDRVAEADMLVQRRSILETQQLNLLATDALAAKPSIISHATPPDRPDRSPLVPDLVLAMLLGAIVGVGLAGLLETLSPTLIGGEAVARRLDTPLIGVLRGGPYRPLPPEDVDRVATRLRLAAHAAKVPSVGLLAVPEDLDVDGLATLLDRAAVAPEVEDPAYSDARERVGVSSAVGRREPDDTHAGLKPRAPARRTYRIRPYRVGEAATNGNVPGLVLVTPSTIKQAHVAAAVHLLRVSPAPLLGLVTYTPPRTLIGSVRRLVRSKGARNGR